MRKLLEPGLERRQKSSYLVIKDRHYRFEAEGVWLDTAAFEDAARTGLAAEAKGELAAAMVAYQSAIALFRSDLLDEPMLLEWFDLDRHRFRTRAREILVALADHAFAEGHFERARELAERLLAIDPASEEAHRRLMAVYGRFGQRDLVLRQFELCRRVLREQLDAEPSQETLATYDKLIQ